MNMGTKIFTRNKPPFSIPGLLKETLRLNKELLELRISYLNSELLKYGNSSKDPAEFLNKLFSGQLSLEEEQEKSCREKIKQLVYLNQELFQTETLYRKLYIAN